MFQKYVISIQRVIGLRKPIFHHFKTYAYEIYVFIKSKNDPDKPGRLQKLASRTHIGYLVGYKSISIYRVWILYKKKMVSAQDVIFNEKAFFDDKPTKIITELMTALDEAVDLVEV